MKLKVHFPHTDHSASVKSLSEEKINKLLKKFDKLIVNIDLYFSNEVGHYNTKLVVKTHSHGKELIASDSDISIHKCLYKVVRKMEKELSKVKEGFSKIHSN